MYCMLPDLAGGMARMCLRLHRPFRRAAEDPVNLDDAAAVLQLHEFDATQSIIVYKGKNQRKQRPRPPVCLCGPQGTKL